MDTPLARIARLFRDASSRRVQNHGNRQGWGVLSAVILLVLTSLGQAAVNRSRSPGQNGLVRRLYCSPVSSGRDGARRRLIQVRRLGRGNRMTAPAIEAMITVLGCIDAAPYSGFTKHKKRPRPRTI
jgi:hypothetical protein